MNGKTEKRLRTMLGDPTSKTLYVYRWHVAEDLDVVVARRGKNGKVWLPWLTTPKPPPWAKRRVSGDNTNSNVYARSPSMKSGDIMQLRVSTPAELEAVAAYVQARVEMSEKWSET